jgi:RHS repeat-associated protein
MTYDKKLSVPTDMIDPNGKLTEADYDAFGRITSVIRPGNGDSVTYPTVELVYHDTGTPFWTEARQRITGAVYLKVRKFYNGLGQLIQTQQVEATILANLKNIVVDTTYDDAGRVRRQSVPYAVSVSSGYFTPESQPYTETLYDVLGRPLSVTAPDGETQTYAYTDVYENQKPRLKTSATNARNKTTDSYTDAFGQTIKVDAPAGADVSYTYDALGRLLSAAYGGAVTSLAYDLGGRKTQMSDADMGVWTYGHDALGNLTTQTDARGCTTTLAYDALNRLTSKVYTGTPASCANTKTVTYNYDSGTNGIGRRTSMQDQASGSVTWTYDDRGRLTAEAKNITSMGTFRTEWVYNSNDSLAWLKYPGGNGGAVGEQVGHYYHEQGVLKAINGLGSTTYVYNIDYDAAGRVDLLKLGATPNLHIDYAYYPWTSQGGRLQYLKSGTPSNPTSLQYFEYDYDPVGNIDWIKDYNAGGTQTQTFTYDTIDRLETAAASGGTGGTYSVETYQYDATTGNLSNKPGLGAIAYNDAAHKHAATHIAGVQKYWYDANGNMTTRTISGVTYTLTYDAENRLISVTGGNTSASFTYDGDGNRVKSSITVNGNITLSAYIGNYFEWTGSTSTMKKYYYAGSLRLAMRTGSGTGTAGLLWLLGDHLGSTSKAANPNGTLYTGSEQRYKAWGEKRFPAGSSTAPTTYRYTGQRQEKDLGGVDGLYFYNARWYDPQLGRFLSADTLIPDPGDPVSYDRYAYSRNNPVRYTDPSGHRSCTAEQAATGDESCDQNYHADDLEYALYSLYGWVVVGEWTVEELMPLLDTGEMIREFINNNFGKDGNLWIKTYLGNAVIHRGGIGENSFVFPKRDVYIRPGASHYTVLHELAHVLDNNMEPGLPATFFGGGAADAMVQAVGGNPQECIPLRFACGGSYDNYYQNLAGKDPLPKVDYGNNSAADDFAQVFAYVISGSNPPPARNNWMRIFIGVLATYLP